jgi:hypothetical protein
VKPAGMRDWRATVLFDWLVIFLLALIPVSLVEITKIVRGRSWVERRDLNHESRRSAS